MADLKFAENHIIAAFLFDPPAAHQEFKSLIHGLKRFCLAHASRSSPITCQDLVKQFRNKASLHKREDGEDTMESVINGKKIVVSEQTVREINDASESESFSVNEEDEDDVSIASEHEEDPVPHVAMVAEEHVKMTDLEVNDDDDSNDDEEEGEDVMNLGDDVVGFNDDDDDELFFVFEKNDDFRPSDEELHEFFDDVHDVVHPTTETGGVSSVLKVTPPTFDQMAET
ncbi:pheromone-processing carboxypeptidase KEX1-like [Lactuca sativa]|uniref:pheromone-processing carboxypeptidase KEX1-like n=1 Tax=Lactuca sativa TaxID=4236 RepID=UPI000CD7FD78|nr:pheromone-processing carboxypeptidase KEX1-like [Lactuca sativa]